MYTQDKPSDCQSDCRVLLPVWQFSQIQSRLSLIYILHETQLHYGFPRWKWVTFSYNYHFLFLYKIIILGTAVVTERGCAPQSLSYRIHKKGKWEVINDIDKEAYKDGCVLENQGDGRPTQYCYCSSRLCNSTPSLNANEQPLLVILLSVLFYLFLLC